VSWKRRNWCQNEVDEKTKETGGYRDNNLQVIQKPLSCAVCARAILFISANL